MSNVPNFFPRHNTCSLLIILSLFFFPVADSPPSLSPTRRSASSFRSRPSGDAASDKNSFEIGPSDTVCPSEKRGGNRGKRDYAPYATLWEIPHQEVPSSLQPFIAFCSFGSSFGKIENCLTWRMRRNVQRWTKRWTCFARQQPGKVVSQPRARL